MLLLGEELPEFLYCDLNELLIWSLVIYFSNKEGGSRQASRSQCTRIIRPTQQITSLEDTVLAMNLF